MFWYPRTGKLRLSYQDLEHVLYSMEDGDFDEALNGELFLAGLQDINGVGVKASDVKILVIDMQARSIWTPGTNKEMLKIHKGIILDSP